MLGDEHFKIMEYEADSSRIFPNTDIKGGIVISYHDETKSMAQLKSLQSIRN